MTEQSNAEMIAENRKWVRLHRGNEYQAEAARRMALILDALEAADQRATEYAAVIEQAEDYVTRHYFDTQMGTNVLTMLVGDDPADVLREMKAEVWEEGYGPDESCGTPRANPYRAREEQS